MAINKSRIFTNIVAVFCISRQMATTAVRREVYSITSLKLGAEVRGVDLNTENRPEVIQQIISDVHKHRLLVFRNQGVIGGARHVQISKWFGELESTFYKHPKSPDPDVFRVSNVPSEGCTGVGRTGWHIDGSFQQAPFAYSLYHMVEVPEEGNTSYAPLYEIIERLSDEQRARWDRLWMVSDRRGGTYHPLIYSHPVTAIPTLCFHLGMTDAFVWDYQSPKERMTDGPETRQILLEIHNEFVTNDGAIQYSHKWRAGDFIISDNLAVGHEATPETQHAVSDVGLRVLHRTTIKGREPPSKKYTSLDQVMTAVKEQRDEL